MELPNIVLRPLVELLRVEPEQSVEQIEIGEPHREVAAKQLPRFICQVLAVKTHFTGFRSVETDNDLGECCLAAAVAANEKDQLAGIERQVNRTQDKILILALTFVGIRHAVEFERLPGGLRFQRKLDHVLSCPRGELEAEVLDFFE